MEARRGSGSWRYGVYTVYLVFLTAIVVNSSVAFSHFSKGRWLLGIWCLVSIFVLPKATLGFAAIAWRNHRPRLGLFDLPFILQDVYPRTFRRYFLTAWDLSFTGHPVPRAILREAIWLAIGIFPIVA